MVFDVAKLRAGVIMPKHRYMRVLPNIESVLVASPLLLLLSLLLVPFCRMMRKFCG